MKNNFVNQCSKYRQAISRIFSMKWQICKIIYSLNTRMNIKNLNGPWNVEFPYLSFDPGLSSEIAIMTTFSRKNENWHDQISSTIPWAIFGICGTNFTI